MLPEFEKKYDSDFREGWDDGNFYIGSSGIMHSGCYGKNARLLPEEAQCVFPVLNTRIPTIEGAHFAHFLECCKEEKPTFADFEYAAGLTELLPLAHLAITATQARKLNGSRQHTLLKPARPQSRGASRIPQQPDAGYNLIDPATMIAFLTKPLSRAQKLSFVAACSLLVLTPRLLFSHQRPFF